MPAIETVDLVKTYGETRALDGLSLTVAEGEVYGLLGPNGAGKTTFINVLVGLTRPTSGDARVFGHDVVEDYQSVRDRIGLAPQEFNVDRFPPIRKVLEYKAGYHGCSPSVATERAERALERVGLSEKADERFSFLSGGMKRRVLLARALVTDPDILILDEPTAGVDVQLRREIWDVVRELNDDGTTILLTTHYIQEAEELCDRVCIIDEGREVEIDTPAELKRRSADAFTIEIDESVPGRLDLDDVDGVVRVDWNGTAVTVQAKQGVETLPTVITRIADAGRRVTGVSIDRASLEDVFVDLTRLHE